MSTTTVRKVASISKHEFSRMFLKCVPPGGWSKRIGVANSGGPDSTCLLFLLNRYLADDIHFTNHAPPRNVISMNIDHDLQTSSATMTEHCSKVASLMGIEHVSYKIPWSHPPYPPRPSPGETFENTARNARYHALFEIMTQVDVNVLAFGHHSDDQVETSLMRLGRGSKEMGAGGMRPCRRWGMGMGTNEDPLGWAGYKGMNRWIVRPLLDVSKDRILATCEDNSLEYVTDATNFQPHLTLRNAIRNSLKNGGIISQEEHTAMPADIVEKLKAINKAASLLGSVSISLSSGVEEIRRAVGQLTSQINDVDKQVDSNLRRCTLTSPPGTYLVSSAGLSRIHDETVRRAMVLRIMRYVSFHPWGSLRADGNRRSTSITQITEKLWNLDPVGSNIGMFVAGGGVLWTPVIVQGNRIKTPDKILRDPMLKAGSQGWLASRQPPLHRLKMESRGLLNPLEMDITEDLTRALEAWKNGAPSKFEVLYDCRFLLCFNFEKMPKDFGKRISSIQERIKVYPNTRWYWPKVVRESYDLTEVLHSKIEAKHIDSLLRRREEDGDHTAFWKLKDKAVSSEWISIEWIRSLEAL